MRSRDTVGSDALSRRSADSSNHLHPRTRGGSSVPALPTTKHGAAPSRPVPSSHKAEAVRVAGLHRRFLHTAARWLPVRDTKADPGADEGGRSHQRRSRESFPDSQDSWELGFRLPRDEEVADKAVPLLGRAYFENCPGCRQEKKTAGRLQRPRFRHGCSLFRVRPGLRTASSTPSRASQPMPRFPAISRAAPTPGYQPHGSGRLTPSRSSPASPGSVLTE